MEFSEPIKAYKPYVLCVSNLGSYIIETENSRKMVMERAS